MVAKSFEAQLKDYEKLSLSQIRHIAVNSIQDVVAGALTPQLGITKGAPGFVEGKIPVAESTLINSFTADGVEGPESYIVALANFEVGDVMEFAWTAEHALPMETGFTIELKDGTKKFVPGRFFVKRNAEQFSDHVEKAIREMPK